MRLKPPPKVVRGPKVDVAIAQLKKIYVPHRRGGLPSLLTELRETLLRLIAFACQSTLWPATRSRRRRVADGVSDIPYLITMTYREIDILPTNQPTL